MILLVIDHFRKKVNLFLIHFITEREGEREIERERET